MAADFLLTARGTDGADYRFTHPIEFQLTRGMDTPAHSLEGVFPWTGREGKALPSPP